MNDITVYHIDEETISMLGLVLTTRQINAQSTPLARVFEYPHLENVFIMENDLYGAVMPGDSCFIAFNGRNGLVGKSLTIEALRNSSPEDIRKLVASNSEG
ncbi:MAG TPA: hypothetical protein VFZ78_09660 [Flavisolibacter sp.]